MDDRTLTLAQSLVTPRYIDAATEALHGHQRTLRSLLAQRRCPEEGLPDEAIEMLLMQLSLMDTNNFPGHVGGGEREGRIASALVRRRVYGMTHGVGRSGDLTADQPKAAGSSLLAHLTNAMMLDLIKLSGAVSTQAAGVVPMATGMTLSLVLRFVANERERACAAAASAVEVDGDSGGCERVSTSGQERPPPRYVIWPRIDQKTCLKCIEAAGLKPYVVPLRRVHARSVNGQGQQDATSQGDQREGGMDVGQGSECECPDAAAFPFFLQVHVDDIRAAVDAVGGPDHVACVLSTTSCFAPRLPDNTAAIAKLCKELSIPYVVNNAYGVQSRPIMAKIDAAMRLGRLDFCIQSGDKNFLVPVGGSVVATGDAGRLAELMALYAGRASAAPVTDLFITALGLGRRGMTALWAQRYERRQELQDALTAFAAARQELLLLDSGSASSVTMRTNAPSTAHVVSAAIDATTTTTTSSSTTTADTNQRDKKTSKSRKDMPPTGNRALPPNDISFCLTMRHYHKHMTVTETQGRQQENNEAEEEKEGDSPLAEWQRMCAAAKSFGAKLFRSGVTGPRVVTPSLAPTTLVGCSFHHYGMHQEGTEGLARAAATLSEEAVNRTRLALNMCPLLVLACGIGMTQAEVSGLMARLEELWPAPPSR